MRNINRSVLLTLLTGLIISLSIFFFIKNWEEMSRANEFNYRAADHAAAIHSELEYITNKVADIRFLIEHDIIIEHDNPLAPDDFMPMVESLIVNDSALISIAWSIIKTNNGQSILETQKEHLQVIYARDNASYKNELSDINLGDYYDEHINKQIDFSKHKAIQIFTHQDNGNSDINELNFIGYIGSNIQNNSDLFSGETIGAVIIEWDIEKIIQRALSKLPIAAQDINLFIVNDDGGKQAIHSHLSRSRSSNDIGVHTGLNQTLSFELSYRDWLLEFEAAPQFLRNHPIIIAFPALFISLLLTFIAVWYIWNVGRQALLIEKKVEERTNELYESTKQLTKLATVIKQTDEIIIITDAEGVTEYVNPAFERISGYSFNEAVGAKPNIVKSGHHSEKFYTAMWNTLKAGKPWKSDFTNKNKAGDTYQVTQSITPIVDENNITIGFSSVQLDVTNQRIMQRKLQHTDRVESLGVLAGGIAHDFNNLLTAILGNTSLTIRKLDVTSPVLKHINAIEAASQSAANLCRQMLAYSGKGKFVIKSVNLSELVENMSKLIEVSLKKDTILQYELNDDLPAIDADVAQMQQIVLNLITNASEAIGEAAGVITMSTGIMDVDSNYLNSCVSGEHTEGCYIYMEISDTGCGMNEEVQKKIFDPFFSTKFTGRGLGMSAMLGIVQGHKGALRIYSEVGKGTTIKVAFPISHECATSIEESTPFTPEWKSSGAVLIIDDEPIVLDVVTVMLKDFGFDVITATDGEEGIEAYERHKDELVLVLLDMTMPKLDGASCFRELKKINPDVRVILSSGYNEQSATNHFVGKGLAGFLQKPYSVDTLAEKLQEALNFEIKS